MKNIAILLMAGGKGERFWPRSRKKHPKQLLSISSSQSMIKETLQRISSIVSSDNVFVSTGKIIEKEMRAELSMIPDENFIIEPIGRNTAPCIGLAAMKIRKKLGDVPLIVLPADHIISPQSLFLNTILAAAEYSKEKKQIVTIGVLPTFPHTGYGYIQIGELLEQKNKIDIFELNKFFEKPNLSDAKAYLALGDFLWNSGMFVWTCNVILEEIKTHLPDLSLLLEEIEPFLLTESEEITIEAIFPQMESISIDYGIMEKTEKAVVIKGTFIWDDVGSWTALQRLRPKDSDGNIIEGPCEVIDTSNCIVMSDKRIVGTIGVKNLVVISTDDALLVCHKDKTEEIKKLIEKLQKYPDIL